MKIIDRYVLLTFVRNYLISFLVLIGLYITLDMVFNFDELMPSESGQAAGALSAATIIADIANYYFYQSFFIYAQLGGVIAVVAAAFTLMRLIRFNELTALLASGMPLLRVAMPIVFCGIFVNGLLVADQELLIPLIAPKLMRNHEQMHMPTARSFPIPAIMDDQKRLLNAARYTPATATVPASMLYVTIIQRPPAAQQITASEAHWNEAAGQWDLIDGKLVISPANPDQLPPPPQPCAAYKSNITPDEINLYRGGQYVQYMATSRINQLLNEPQSYGTAALLRIKHMRFTQPLDNCIMLLLGVATILCRNPTELKRSALSCLALTAIALAFTFIAYQLAATPMTSNPAMADLWPALMAWMPIFLFGPMAVYLLDRVES